MNVKTYAKQALFVLAVIAITKMAQSSLKIDQTQGIGLYLP